MYSIIFFEHSPKEFHRVPNQFIHHYQQRGNTGVELELLQKYIFITLDNFLGMEQNKDISNRLNANTVKYMIDEMQEEIDQQKLLLAEKDAALAEKDAALQAALLQLAQLKKERD